MHHQGVVQRPWIQMTFHFKHIGLLSEKVILREFPHFKDSSQMVWDEPKHLSKATMYYTVKLLQIYV